MSHELTACSVTIVIVLILDEVVREDTTSFFEKCLLMISGLVEHFLMGWCGAFKGGQIAFYPYRMTGNLPNRQLSGEYLFLLVLYKLVLPHSSYLECIAFITNKTATAKIFSEQDVSLALHCLGYSMKVTSTVVYQVFTE